MNAKKLKRGMALFLSVVMLATSSMGIPTFAESVQDQMVSENKTDQGNQEVEKPQEDTTSENEVVSDGEQDSENEIVSENKIVSEDTVSQDEIMTGTLNSIGIPIGGMTAQPDSYSADIAVSINSTNYEAHKFFILYSDSESNLPTEETIESINCEYKTYYETENKGNGEQIIHFNLNPLHPQKTIYFQLFFKKDSTYYMITQPASFTTEAPITQSRISLSDITVKEVGYTAAKVEFRVVNPDDEYITEDGVCITDGTNEYSASNMYDEEDKLVPGMYTSNVFLGKDPSKEFKPEVKVYTGDMVETPVTGASVTIPAKAYDGLQITCTPKSSANSATMNIKLDPYYLIDIDNMHYEITYKQAGSDNIQSETEYATSNYIISLTNLTENTEYEYTLNIYGDNSYTNILKKCTGSFKTEEDKAYTVSDFDEQIFKNIKNQLSLTSDTIKQSQLETITKLTITSKDVTAPVQSLKGVEHLTNITDLEITGQNVESASEIQHLISLRYVNLAGNKITEMPDLSELFRIGEIDESDLQFDYNFIASSSITKAKLPARMRDNNFWINQTQSNQLESTKTEYITADTYYAVGEKYPFLFEADNIPAKRGYKLAVSVDGKESTLTKEDENGKIYYTFLDIGIATGTYPVEISLTDCYGNNLWEDTRTIKFVGDEELMRDTYGDAYDENVSVAGYIPGNSKVIGVQLKNAEGAVVGKDNYIDSYVNKSLGSIYDGIFNFTLKFDIDSWSNVHVYATVLFSKELTPGDYNLVFTTEDGKEYSFVKTVHISAKTVIMGMDTSRYKWNQKNDTAGDYYYVDLVGINIDPKKVWPVIQTKDGRVISEKGSVVHLDNNSYQYQLKKLEKDIYWKEGSIFKVTIGSESGYEFVDDRGYKTFYYFEYGGHVLSEYYNYRSSTNKYRVHFDSKVTNETKVSMKLYSDSDYTTKLAVTEGTVKNGWANLNLKDLQGNEFVPERNKTYYEKIVYSGNYNEIDSNKNEIIWYGVNSDSSSSLSYILHSDDAIRKADSESIDFAITLLKQTDTTQTFEAYLGKTLDPKQGDAVKLLAEETTYEGKKCVKLTGKRTGAVLSSGMYYLSVYCNDTLQVTPQIAVYNNDLFYMEDNYAYGTSSGEYKVQINSSQLRGEYKKVYNSKVIDADALKLVNDSYTFEVYDLIGREIKGWSVNSASYSGGMICISLKGIPADYKGCYIKVLSKTKNKEGYTLDGTDSTLYYGQKPNNVDPSYGYCATRYKASIEFQTSSIPFDQSTSWSSYDKILIGERSGMLPVMVKFYKRDENTPIKTLKINQYGMHQFTSSELSGISSTEIYDVTAESADCKQCNSITGFVGVITSATDVQEPDITLSLNKTSISMQEGETAELTATLSSTTVETLSWSSSNQKVATVDNNGTVKAIGAGTAIITASLSGGASAKCQIVVMGKTDSDAIDVAGTTIKAVKKQNYTGQMITPKLTVMNGKVALVENADYILSYRDNKNAGTDTAVAVIYGIGAYKGTKEIKFTIMPKAIKGASIEAYDVIATSVAQSPSVIVMNNGIRLTEGTDFNVTGLKNNQKPGTGKFTIEGINNYTGKKAGSFRIYPTNTKIMTGLSISASIPVESYTYDGTKKTPVMTVKDSSDAVLQLNKDYTVSYKNNVNAGTAIAIVKGKGSNKGTKDFYFKIKPMEISANTIIDEITAVKYSGSALNPKVVVKSKEGSKAGKKLRLNKDYTLTYSNNYQASAITGAQTATVVITGIGNYRGTVTKEFLINKIVLGKGFSVKELKTQTYPGNALTPTFKLYYKKRLLKQNQDYTVTYNKNIKVGKWEIVITAAENSSFTGSITKTFKIKK
ncbi:MAG: Ig-like domain-containing protein [Lachnospiraceae bacterium]|nr:Ig-like domain-containing protein [Lachnospiraceae bacterium]